MPKPLAFVRPIELEARGPPNDGCAFYLLDAYEFCLPRLRLAAAADGPPKLGLLYSTCPNGTLFRSNADPKGTPCLWLAEALLAVEPQSTLGT